MHANSLMVTVFYFLVFSSFCLVLTTGEKTQATVEQTCLASDCQRINVTFKDGERTWKSPVLRLVMRKTFGPESCMFYVNEKKDQRIAFYSMCEEGTVKRYEGLFFVESGKQLILTLDESKGGTRELREIVPPSQRPLPWPFSWFPWLWRSLRPEIDHTSSFCQTVTKFSQTNASRGQIVTNRGIDSGTEDAIVEIALSGDHQFVKKYGNKDRAERHMFQVMTGVTAIFQLLDIGIKIVDSRIFDENATNSIVAAAKDYASMLNSLKDYYSKNVFQKENEGKVPDVVVTFTGRPYYDEVTEGIAYVGNLCDRFAHALILWPTKSPDVPLMAYHAPVAAHEVAHVVGVNHQDNCTTDGRRCDDGDGRCFMAANVGFSKGNWSSCTFRDIERLKQFANKTCLYRFDVTADSGLDAGLLGLEYVEPAPQNQNNATGNISITVVLVIVGVIVLVLVICLVIGMLLLRKKKPKSDKKSGKSKRKPLTTNNKVSKSQGNKGRDKKSSKKTTPRLKLIT